MLYILVEEWLNKSDATADCDKGSKICTVGPFYVKLKLFDENHDLGTHAHMKRV